MYSGSRQCWKKKWAAWSRVNLASRARAPLASSRVWTSSALTGAPCNDWRDLRHRVQQLLRLRCATRGSSASFACLFCISRHRLSSLRTNCVTRWRGLVELLRSQCDLQAPTCPAFLCRYSFLRILSHMLSFCCWNGKINCFSLSLCDNPNLTRAFLRHRSKQQLEFPAGLGARSQTCREDMAKITDFLFLLLAKEFYVYK